MKIAVALLLFSLSALITDAINLQRPRHQALDQLTMNVTESPSAPFSSAQHILPVDFELFDPPNLYLYHDYVIQGLPKFMTGVELSTAAQRFIFIVHWSVRYFIVIVLVLETLH